MLILSRILKVNYRRRDNLIMINALFKGHRISSLKSESSSVRISKVYSSTGTSSAHLIHLTYIWDFPARERTSDIDHLYFLGVLHTTMCVKYRLYVRCSRYQGITVKEQLNKICIIIEQCVKIFVKHKSLTRDLAEREYCVVCEQRFSTIHCSLHRCAYQINMIAS